MQPHTVTVANNAIAVAAAAAAAAAAASHVPRPSAYTYATTYAVQSSPSYTFVQQPPQKADIYSQIRTNLITPGGSPWNVKQSFSLIKTNVDRWIVKF